MARTAPVPNIPAIPGMNPGIFIAGGGGGGGGGNGDGGGGSGHGKGGKGQEGGTDATGGGKNAKGCGPGSGGGCPNPVHGGGGTSAGDPIDPTTGRVYTIAVADMALPGLIPLAIMRSYSSHSRDQDIGLGFGWTHSLSWSISERRRDMRVHDPGAAPTVASRLLPGKAVLLPCGTLTRHAWGFSLAADNFTRVFAEQVGKRWMLSSVQDANRNLIVLKYDRGALSEIVDSVGRQVRVRLGRDGRIALFEVALGEHGPFTSFRRYEYSARGDLVAAVDPLGHTERYEYDSEHRLLARRQPGGLVARFQYDAEGRGTATWCERPDNDGLDPEVPALLPDGTRAKGFLHVKLSYFGKVTEIVNSRGKRRLEGNDLHKTDTSVWGGGVHSFAYDGAGNIMSYEDAVGSLWQARRGPNGHVQTITDPEGGRTDYAYREDGFVQGIRDEAGAVTRYERDPNGNLLSIEDGLGEVVSFKYDARGQVVESRLPNGGITRLAYDGHGNRIEVVEPDGAIKRISYDYIGRVRTFVDALGTPWQYEYDACGRLVEVRGPSGVALRRDYDADGNIARIVDLDSRATVLRWGGFGVVTEILRPDGTVVHYRYDREQELVCVENEVGERHRIVRSSAGYIVGEHTFDGRKVAYDHDAMGRIVTVRREKTMTTFVYDALGRLVERNHSDDRSDKFTYDALGRILTATNGETTCAYEYDVRGNVVREEVTAEGHTVANESHYDPLGYVVQESTGDAALQLRRDASGRPTEVTVDDAAPLRLRYDRSGREVERLLPGVGRLRSEYSRDGRLRLIAVEQPAAGPGEEPRWVGGTPPNQTLWRGYEWSRSGDLVAVDGQDGGRVELPRDINGRVAVRRTAAATLESFAYSPSGDVQERHIARSYDAGGRGTARGETSYRYDDLGRVIEKRREKEGGAAVWNYEWHDDGTLAHVDTPEGTRVAFLYDCFARRIQKRIERGGKTIATTRFSWRGEALAHEVTERARAKGDPIVEERSYANVPGNVMPFAYREKSGDAWGPLRHIVYSATGFPDAVVDDDGVVVGWAAATLYGKVEAQNVPTALRFPGHYEDVETGLFFNRHRYYDPEMGQYLSPEPMGLAGSLKAYAYVDNYPLDWVDPDGLARATICREPPSEDVKANSSSNHALDAPDRNNRLHPAVAAALPPDNARLGDQNPDASSCAEPMALSKHLFDFEKNTGKQINPNQRGWQKNLGESLDQINSIETKKGGDATPTLKACPNCTQTISRLYALAGKAVPDGLVKGGGMKPKAGFDAATNAPQNTELGIEPFKDASGKAVVPGVFNENFKPV